MRVSRARADVREQLRRAWLLGLHGTFEHVQRSGCPGLSNRLPRFRTQLTSPQCTWEGDNTILSLQSGRSLIASYEEAVSGKKQPGGTAYLNSLPGVLSTLCSSNASATDLETMDAAWGCVAANVVKKAAEVYAGFLKSGKEKDEALEMCSQERFIAAKVHTTGYIYRFVSPFCSGLSLVLTRARRQFRDSLVELAKTEDPSNGVVEMLEMICKLYGTWSIEENAQYFLKYGFYNAEQMDLISAEVRSFRCFAREEELTRARAGELAVRRDSQVGYVARRFLQLLGPHRAFLSFLPAEDGADGGE